jgi:hypothetical protein
MIVEGNYPVDFYTKESRTFNTEDEASRQASRLLANCNNVDVAEADKDKEWDDLIAEIFKK